MHRLRYHIDPQYYGNRYRKIKRVFSKNGNRNIEYILPDNNSWMLIKDLFTAILDAQWRYVFTIFSLSYFVSWTFFAILWYLIQYEHGDLDVDPITGEFLKLSTPCVENSYSFIGMFIYSVESQTSIGYGTKYPTDECPAGVALLPLHIATAICIEGAVIGIVYAKMTRSNKYASDMKFGRKAVICQRDSKLCLIFRVCDSAQDHTVQSKIEAIWYEENFSAEGEKLRNFQNSLKLDNENIFLLYPLTVCHVIDENSPLYEVSAKDLLTKKFEIILTLTGNSISTSKTNQSRTSYLPKEIMWGYRFKNIVEYNKSKETYFADYDKFDDLEKVNIPLYSAKDLYELSSERKFTSTDIHPLITDEINTEQMVTVEMVKGQVPKDTSKEKYEESYIKENQKKIIQELILKLK